MNYKQKCSCCGSEITAYTHNINKDMVMALMKLNAYYQKFKKAVNINQDLGLSHNQMCNLPKLQYYKLIIRAKNGDWFLTVDGINFLKGEVKVLTPVATINNEVIPTYHEAWKTHNSERVYKSINDFIDEYPYKKREEYQAERSDQKKLF